mgnify:CR=1 FL=1
MFEQQKEQPLVSIIIPVFNRLKEFERALLSAGAQDYRNIEIIVVDDGSKDNIESVIEKNFEIIPFPIQYIWQENQGPGGARQKGLGFAKGKYVQYLDADDVIEPTKIRKQVETLNRNPEAIACICGRPKYVFSTDLLELALNANCWATSSVLWHYPDKSIAVWPEFIGGQDIVHYATVAIDTRKIVWLDEKLVKVLPSTRSHSQMTKKGHMRERRLRDNFKYPIRLYELVKGAGLLNNRKYSEPLAERLFRIGFQFAVIGERTTALNLLRYSFRTSQAVKKKLEIIIAYFTILISGSRTPLIYEKLFKLHRKINPVSLHVNKSITTLKI